ncbi:MAG TPA: hypothetical protein VLB76_25255 [Thermoanaerobaculia bacterium]|nr:hypothetical protein [Thermoanaerobaculia bacterium]
MQTEAEGFATGVEDPGERGAGRAVEAVDGAREDPRVAFADRLLAPRLEVDPDLDAGSETANGPLPRRRPSRGCAGR